MSESTQAYNAQPLEVRVVVRATDFELFALSAVRHALGRSTSLVDDTCAAIERAPLSQGVLKAIWRNVDAQICNDDHLRSRGYRTQLPLGMDVDRERWLAFRDHLVKRLGGEPEPPPTGRVR